LEDDCGEEIPSWLLLGRGEKGLGGWSKEAVTVEVAGKGGIDDFAVVDDGVVVDEEEGAALDDEFELLTGVEEDTMETLVVWVLEVIRVELGGADVVLTDDEI
jgi:hypothetical protein